MDRNLANAVARCGTVSVDGTFYRHASMGARPLSGSEAGGRWGPRGAYPVLYLGRPLSSVTVEAYRLLVDPFSGMTGDMVAPRHLYTYDLRVSELLDLRIPGNLTGVGLNEDNLRGLHPPRPAGGAAAHQHGLLGFIASAATGLGETLALFLRHLPDAEQPSVTEDAV